MGKKEALKFISFVYKNSDRTVKWEDMTGAEQFEWHKAWLTAGKTHDAVDPNAVLGLKGTDLNQIQTAEQLETALQVSASARKRRPEPHPLAQDAWRNVARRLDLDE